MGDAKLIPIGASQARTNRTGPIGDGGGEEVGGGRRRLTGLGFPGRVFLVVYQILIGQGGAVGGCGSCGHSGPATDDSDWIEGRAWSGGQWPTSHSPQLAHAVDANKVRETGPWEIAGGFEIGRLPSHQLQSRHLHDCCTEPGDHDDQDRLMHRLKGRRTDLSLPKSS